MEVYPNFLTITENCERNILSLYSGIRGEQQESFEAAGTARCGHITSVKN